MTMAALYLYVLLAFLPVIVGAQSGYHRYDLGCKCYPGYYVSTPCSPKQGADCTKCPHGKFSSKLDLGTSCQDCSLCGIYSEISTPCNPVNDTVCKCKVGKVPKYFEDKFAHCENPPEPPDVEEQKPGSSTESINPNSGANLHFLGVSKKRTMAMVGLTIYTSYIGHGHTN